MSDLVPLTSPLAEGLICWLAETTLVASVLVIVAHFGGRIPRLGPAVRHALWLVVLVKLVTPPLIHWPWSQPWPRPEAVAVAPRTPDPVRMPMSRTTDTAEIHRDHGRRHPDGLIAKVSTLRETSEPDATAPAIAPTSEAPPSGEPARPVVGWRAALVGLGHAVRVRLGAGLAAAWLVGSIAVGVVQLRGIQGFRRILSRATPAPRWLVEEAERIGRRMGIRVPTIRVVNRPGTPLLWCLGRPVMLVPADLLESLEPARWRAVLAHELAHLRRGDPWVRRLELVAGLVWWWNPLYWLALRRLDFEAELACDAWVLWALPDDRLGYAESLVRICTSLSTARSPVPALGVAGSGRSFERRLMMILRDRVAHNASAPGILAAALLAALALPSWTLANPAREEASAVTSVTALEVATTPIAADDDDDDDDKPKPAKKPKAAKAKKTETKAKAKPPKEDDEAAIEAKVKEALGPDFEKKMEAMGEKLGKEMEKKFGPGSDFEKKMEAFGKQMEEKFGPEFEKQMEAFGKDFEKKFGPEFEKKMEAFGKDMEKSFGPKFEKEMEAFGKEMAGFGEKMAKELGEGSDFAEKMKKLEGLKAKAKVTTKEKDERARPAAKPKAAAKGKAERIEVLEAQINGLMKELKRLKADDGDDDEEDDEDMDDDKDGNDDKDGDDDDRD